MFSRRLSISISVGADNKPLFTNPAAVQKAAAVLGTTQEEISEIIFAPPIVNQFTIRMRRASSSKSSSSLSPSSSVDNTPEKQAKTLVLQYTEALEGFAMGLYQEAFAALLRFINRYLLWDENTWGPLISELAVIVGRESWMVPYRWTLSSSVLTNYVYLFLPIFVHSQ